MFPDPLCKLTPSFPLLKAQREAPLFSPRIFLLDLNNIDFSFLYLQMHLYTLYVLTFYFIIF